MRKLVLVLMVISGFVLAGEEAQKEPTFEQKCQKIREEMLKDLKKIAQKQNPKLLEGDQEALNAQLDKVLTINAFESMRGIDEFVSKPVLLDYDGVIPSKGDIIYANAYKNDIHLNRAIQIGYAMEKSRRNIMAALAIVKSDSDKNLFRNALDKLGDWDQRLIGLLANPKAKDLSKAHAEHFEDFWKRYKELKHKVKSKTTVDV